MLDVYTDREQSRSLLLSSYRVSQRRFASLLHGSKLGGRRRRRQDFCSVVFFGHCDWSLKVPAIGNIKIQHSMYSFGFKEEAGVLTLNDIQLHACLLLISFLIMCGVAGSAGPKRTAIIRVSLDREAMAMHFSTRTPWLTLRGRRRARCCASVRRASGLTAWCPHCFRFEM